jgi:hypothetical protein
MENRGDSLTADLMLGECLLTALRLWHHICNVYPPHDKWLHRSLKDLPEGEQLAAMLSQLHLYLGKRNREDVAAAREKLEELGSFFARAMYRRNLISDINPYLDCHTEELLQKSLMAKMTQEELVNEIARVEFEAFDKVKNVGGRAYCQNDWPTFSVMRKSQYLTWNREMLLQYLYDFKREYARGHNLITEKYGRMMESTALEEYEAIKENFPPLSPEKKGVIEQIVSIQMTMMEEFAAQYPEVASNARRLHSYEDDLADTSYETYLRGEISTYSDNMLQLYGGFVVQCSRENVNIARKTIENTARLYGYEDIETFNEMQKRS